MLIFYAYEDAPLKAVAIKLIKQEKAECELAVLEPSGDGNSQIFNNLDVYRELSARISSVILFIDLDNKPETPCSPSLLRAHPINNRQSPPQFQIRIAVRTVESWLLADKEGMEQYFGIPQDAIIDNPEELPNPKQVLLNLIKRNATKEVRHGMLPIDGARVGLEYNNYLTDFINTAWDSTRACANADSLVRAIKGIQKITP